MIFVVLNKKKFNNNGQHVHINRPPPPNCQDFNLTQTKYCYLGCPSTHQSELPRSFQFQVGRNEFIFFSSFPSCFLHHLPTLLLCSTDASFPAENCLEWRDAGGWRQFRALYLQLHQNRCLALGRWMDVHSVTSQLSWAQDPRRWNPSTYYLNGLAAPKPCHRVLSVRLQRLVSQKWAGTVQFVQVFALPDMPQQKVLFLFCLFFNSGSLRQR